MASWMVAEPGNTVMLASVCLTVTFTLLVTIPPWPSSIVQVKV